MKRTFIAVKIQPGEALHALLREVQTSLTGEKINWVDPANLHITLFFLGDTEEDEIEEVKDLLGEISNDFSSFRFRVNSLGVFKSPEEPRVLWAGIEESDELEWLQRMISDELEYMGFETGDPPFHPHMTLGRIKELSDKTALSTLLDKYRDTPFQSVQVKDIIFYESVLHPEGARYRSLRNFKLK